MGAFSDALKQKKGGGGFAAAVRGDPEADILNQSSLDRSGMSSISTRFSVAGGDNLEEKNLIFQKRFPNGVIERVPGTGTLVYKENKDDPNERFKTIENEEKTKIGGPFGARIPNIREGVSDVAEFVGENKGPIAGEIAASLHPGLRGAKLLKTSLAEGVGAAGGELAEQGLQEIQGVNTQPWQEVLNQAGQEGGLATVGSAGFSLAAKPMLNVGRGAGLLKETPGAVEAEQARQFLNTQIPEDKAIPPFTPGQVSETPILTRLDEQSIALAGGLKQQRRNQMAGAALATRTAAKPRDLVRARNNAVNALESEKRKITNAINGSGNFDDAGEALKAALKTYSENSQKQVSALYDTAAQQAPSVGDPQFDFSDALSVADELERGVQAVAREGGTVDAQSALAPELRAVINDLRAIDPSFPGGEGIAPSWQVLDNLRQRLFDLKTPNPGEAFRSTHRQANEMYKAITKTLDEPVGGDATFRQAWGAARKQAKDRFDKLELSNIVRLARTDETTGFAQRLAQPGSADALRQLGSTLDEKSMRQVTDAFKKDMANDLDKFTTTLKSFDKETLGRLLPPDEINRFNTISDSLEKLSSSGVSEALQRQSRSRLFVRDLIQRSDSAGASALMDMVRTNGGTNGPLGSSIRAGLVDDFFEDVVTLQGDGGQITVSLLNDRLKQLRNLGFGPLLTPKDRQTMKSVLDIAPFIKVSRGGAGASIQAADVGENIISFGDPKAQVGGIFSILQKIGYARTMQNPGVRRFLIGHGREAVNPSRTLAVMGAALTTGLTEIEHEAEAPPVGE